MIIIMIMLIIMMVWPIISSSTDHARPSVGSLLMIDLDSVQCLEKGTAYLHWAAVNITGTDMSSGFEVRL